MKKSDKKKKAKDPAIEKILLRVQIIGMIVMGVAIAAGIFLLYQSLPVVRVKRALQKGNAYSANADYQDAVTAYQAAISLDSTSVQAYQNMATAYLSLKDIKSAKSTLYTGWENTQNEELFSNYLTVSLNEAVTQMNNGAATLDTVSQIVDILEKDPDHADALQVLDKAYDYTMLREDENGINVIFWTTEAEASSFSQYSDIMNRLIRIYEKSPSDGLKKDILKYLEPAGGKVWFTLSDAKSYEEILTLAQSDLGDTNGTTSLLNCIQDAQNELKLFQDIFTQMDAGTLEAARDFITGDIYTGVKKKFTEGQNGVWENSSEIPVSREGIVLTDDQTNGWTYHFMNFGENPATKGMITVWTTGIKDDGVEHIQMSYEPAEVNNTYYPHTQYTISYIYSNVSVNGKFVPKMNYRLDTTVYQSEGETTKNSIGDWGGENEWTLDFNNLSYLSKK